MQKLDNLVCTWCYIKWIIIIIIITVGISQLVAGVFVMYSLAALTFTQCYPS